MHEPIRRHLRSLLAGTALAGVVLGLGACSGSPSSTALRHAAPSATTAAPSAAQRAASTAARKAQQQAARQAGATVAGTATFPAVGGATDLGKEPTIAAGTQPAPTTLQTRDLVVGTGATATATSTVTIHYVGANYADGRVFDASWTDPGGPTATFPLTNTVPGFGEGIAGMKVGGRREIVIPPALGYGANAQGPISANEELVFVVDLLAVK